MSDIRTDDIDGSQIAKYIKDSEKLNKTPIIAVNTFPDSGEKSCLNWF